MKNIDKQWETNNKLIRENPFVKKKSNEEETKLIWNFKDNKDNDHHLMNLKEGNMNLDKAKSGKDINYEETIKEQFKNQITGVEKLLKNDNTISWDLNQKLEIWYRLEEVIDKNDPNIPIANLIDVFPNYFSSDENDMDNLNNKRKGIYQIKKSFLENKIDNPTMREDELFKEMKGSVVDLLLKRFIGDGKAFNIVTRREEQKIEEIDKTSEDSEIIEGTSSDIDSAYNNTFSDVYDKTITPFMNWPLELNKLI